MSGPLYLQSDRPVQVQSSLLRSTCATNIYYRVFAWKLYEFLFTNGKRSCSKCRDTSRRAKGCMHQIVLCQEYTGIRR
jgi:hypothetical protein